MKLTEFIGITSRNMHVKFGAVWRSFQFLTEKCQQCRTLEKGWNFDIFSKFSEIHETYRMYWNHIQEHACAIWSSLEKFQFSDRKMPTAPDLRKRMIFWHFLKGELIGITTRNMHLKFEALGEVSKFRKLTEFIRITARNMHMKFEAVWRSFNFWQKNADSAGALEKGWTFDIFSKFSEIHETYRIYWNHLQEHACEIWSSLEKFQFLTEKCQQCRTLEKGWNFDIFSKFSEIHETYRIYWNHIQEHACAIWSSLEKFQFLTEKCRQRRTLEKGWNFDIFSKFSEIHDTYRIYWNHLPGTCLWNLEQFGEVSIFDRKMPTV